jgi:hypothetical protein
MNRMRRFATLAVAILALAAACSSASNSSVVTGYIEPCVGLGPSPRSHAAGTVTALRGTEKLVRVSPDEQRAILPTDVAATSHTSGDKPFKLRLAPGAYVLVGKYDEFPTTTTRLSLLVPRSTTLQRNLPNLCK